MTMLFSNLKNSLSLRSLKQSKFLKNFNSKEDEVSEKTFSETYSTLESRQKYLLKRFALKSFKAPLSSNARFLELLDFIAKDFNRFEKVYSSSNFDIKLYMLLSLEFNDTNYFDTTIIDLVCHYSNRTDLSNRERLDNFKLIKDKSFYYKGQDLRSQENRALYEEILEANSFKDVSLGDLKSLMETLLFIDYGSHVDGAVDNNCLLNVMAILSYSEELKWVVERASEDEDTLMFAPEVWQNIKELYDLSTVEEKLEYYSMPREWSKSMLSDDILAIDNELSSSVNNVAQFYKNKQSSGFP